MMHIQTSLDRTLYNSCCIVDSMNFVFVNGKNKIKRCFRFFSPAKAPKPLNPIQSSWNMLANMFSRACKNCFVFSRVNILPVVKKCPTFSENWLLKNVHVTNSICILSSFLNKIENC